MKYKIGHEQNYAQKFTSKQYHSCMQVFILIYYSVSLYN